MRILQIIVIVTLITLALAGGSGNRRRKGTSQASQRRARERARERMREARQAHAADGERLILLMTANSLTPPPQMPHSYQFLTSMHRRMKTTIKILSLPSATLQIRPCRH